MSYIIDNEEFNILEKDWKYLALFDACRYDYFKEMYRLSLGSIGHLQKARCTSLGTIEWQKELLGDCSDVIYLNTTIRFDCRFAEHGFFKVVNVWEKGWSKKLGTTPAKAVNDAFIEQVKKHPDKRIILHYMQPHTPYVLLGGQPSNTIKKHLNEERGEKHQIISDLISESTAWTIKKWLRIKPSLPIEAHYMKFGKHGVIEAYKNEIRLVLYHVQKLIIAYPGNWVLTADHGVTVGERGRFGHCRVNKKEVYEVPWLEIE